MEKGFTLIELLIILLIIGVLFFAAIPPSSRFIDSIKLNGTAKEIASELRALQIRAIAGNTLYEISFEANKYVVSREDLFEAKRVEIKTIELSRSLYFDKPVKINFASSGFPKPGGFGTVILRSKSGSRKIIGSSVGRVRIE